ncbi:MAG TPA: nucleotide pyrophosphohydrolase [Oligoflexia bacterium]|nr:nucleotide pyrophosphohydrolase [Oligoflexia bacterium]HMP26974.1 nucleotide pyrophosphohydrolase [Oligoflexia bacterium]
MNETPKQLEKLKKLVINFRRDRDWEQFHTIKDRLLALSAEVAELSEIFLWLKDGEIESAKLKRHKEISDELADIFYWLLILSNDLKIDLAEALSNKMKENELKYPINKAKGVATKYTTL